MAADWVELGKEVLKLAVRARYSFSLWVTSLVILVCPLPTFIKMESFRQDNGQYIGLVFLAMFVVWVVEIALMLSEQIKTYMLLKREEKKTLQHIDSLNPGEAHLLVIAVEKQIQTVTWREDGDEVSSLIAKGLLSKVPDNSKMFHKPFTVPRFVWEEINKTSILEELRKLEKKV